MLLKSLQGDAVVFIVFMGVIFEICADENIDAYIGGISLTLGGGRGVEY